MILKIATDHEPINGWRYFEGDDFTIVLIELAGEVGNIVRNSENLIKGFVPDNFWAYSVCIIKHDDEHKHEQTHIWFNTDAYLLNNDGKTIEKFRRVWYKADL